MVPGIQPSCCTIPEVTQQTRAAGVTGCGLTNMVALVVTQSPAAAHQQAAHRIADGQI